MCWKANLDWDGTDIVTGQHSTSWEFLSQNTEDGKWETQDFLNFDIFSDNI